MKLVTFIQQLVDHPEQMAAFKADPDTFLAGQEPSFRRELLAALRSGSVNEVSTIIRMSSPPTGADAPAADPDALDLTGRAVVLSARATFLAEPRGNSVGKQVALAATLLPHSYIAVTQRGHVLFDIHLCFIDPDDRYDKPQVLYIRTADAPLDLADRSDTLQPADIVFSPNTYLLVREDDPLQRKLCAGSSYNQQTRQLVLVLDDTSA